MVDLGAGDDAAPMQADKGDEEQLSWKRLFYAPPLDFKRRPASDEAQALVGHLSRLIPLPLQRQQRASARMALETALGGMTGTLAALVDYITPNEGGSLPPMKVSKDSRWYSRQPTTYSQFIKVYDAFKEAELIRTVTPGHRIKGPGPIQDDDAPTTADNSDGPHFGRGFQERIAPTRAFIALVRDHGIALGTAAVEHFPIEDYAAPDLLQVRHKGELIDVPPEDAAELARMRQEMAELNSFIREVRIEGTWLGALVRRFSADDDDPADWKNGGRLYADPSPSYQSLSERKRVKYLRLDGEPVVEIDIRASFLSIAYALRGQSLLEETRTSVAFPDPYPIDGLPRAAVKEWINASFGYGKHLTNWPRETAQGWRKEGIRARDVKVAVLKRHPILKDFSGFSWGPLQRIESDALMATMLRLKRGYGIPALPVHDSILVPQSARREAAQALRVSFVETTGQQPLSFKFTPDLTPIGPEGETPF